MTQTGAHEEEVTLMAGGAREDAKISEDLIQMQKVVAGHVENQTILKETVLGKNKETEDSRVIMHPLMQRGFSLCSI